MVSPSQTYHPGITPLSEIEWINPSLPDYTLTNTDSTNRTTYRIGSYDNYLFKEYSKGETKKERIKRVAKEKMLASWKVYNQKTETTIDIKQICKPRHRLNHMGNRR